MSKRRLRDDERELWQQVARSTTPLPQALRRAVQTPLIKPDKTADKTPEISLPEAFGISRNERTSKPQITTPKVQSSSTPVMDKKTFSKMRRGKLVPEGKIDLHGMTLDQAHPALTRFILTSQARGLRLVLVITGKGDRNDPYDPMPRQRGVLKRQVPMWLKMAPLSLIVMDVNEAHLRHGGGGAYYVYLRKTSRT